MDVTDELRRMLDERGVEWYELQSVERCYRITRWKDEFDRYVSALDSGGTKYFLDFYWGPTPQQAVEATLGRGTCRRVLYKPTGVLVCSECGAGIPKQLDKYCYLHYCPNCGRKVEEEDDE